MVTAQTQEVGPLRRDGAATAKAATDASNLPRSLVCSCFISEDYFVEQLQHNCRRNFLLSSGAQGWVLQLKTNSMT